MNQSGCTGDSMRAAPFIVIAAAFNAARVYSFLYPDSTIEF